MTDQVFDLDAAPDPKYKIRVGGEVLEFDPFELAEKLQGVDPSGDGGSSEATFDAVRAAFGMPAKGAGKTISGAVCLALVADFSKFLKGLDVLGELQRLTPNSADSTASAPSTSASSPAPTAAD